LVSPSTVWKSFHIRLLPTNFRLSWLARSIIDSTTSSKRTPGFAWYLMAKWFTTSRASICAKLAIAGMAVSRQRFLSSGVSTRLIW